MVYYIKVWTSKPIAKTFYLMRDNRVIKRHLQSVAMSVVGMNNFRDRVHACIFKWKCTFVSIQLKPSQLYICRDSSQVDGEQSILKNSLIISGNGARQQGRGQRPVRSEPGLYVILIQQELLQVEMKDVKLVEAASYETLWDTLSL